MVIRSSSVSLDSRSTRSPQNTRAGRVEREDLVRSEMYENEIVADPLRDNVFVRSRERHEPIVDRNPAVLPVVGELDRPYPLSVPDPLEQPEDAIRRVYAYVAYRIGAGADAEDITSATIERAIRYRNSYRKDEGSPTAWLIGIARRCLADAFASRGQEQLGATEMELGSGDYADKAAIRIDLHRAVAHLDARSRDLVALRYGADLSSKDIARIYEMSPGAVDVALHRALKELRTILEAPEPTGRLPD